METRLYGMRFYSQVDKKSQWLDCHYTHFLWFLSQGITTEYSLLSWLFFHPEFCWRYIVCPGPFARVSGILKESCKNETRVSTEGVFSYPPISGIFTWFWFSRDFYSSFPFERFQGIITNKPYNAISKKLFQNYRTSISWVAFGTPSQKIRALRYKIGHTKKY